MKYTKKHYKEESAKKSRIVFDIDTSRYRMHGPRIVKRIKIDL